MKDKLKLFDLLKTIPEKSPVDESILLNLKDPSGIKIDAHDPDRALNLNDSNIAWLLMESIKFRDRYLTPAESLKLINLVCKAKSGIIATARRSDTLKKITTALTRIQKSDLPQIFPDPDLDLNGDLDEGEDNGDGAGARPAF